VYLLYNVLLSAAFVLAAPYYLWKGRGSGKYLKSFRERLGRAPLAAGSRARPSGAGSRPIWVHAVSVGEVLAARTLLAPLAERLPGHGVVLSTTTVTGHAVAQRDARAADALFFAPFDLRGPVRRVLDATDPRLLVLVETELWPNLIHEAKQRGVAVALVNGRISPRSFPRYRRVRGLLRRVLDEVDLFLMQGESHAQRIRELGAPASRVRVTGNLKFDALPPPAPGEGLRRALAPLAERPLWVAGSTVAGEEPLVLAAFQELRARFPRAALLVAPRHPERFAEVAALVEGAGFRCARRSQPDGSPAAERDVLLLDTLGELAQVYPLATVVFVGGSLVPAGGHNLLEAAVAGRAVVVGPHMENFREIAEEFRAGQALVQVASAEALGRELTGLLGDAARREELGARARALVERNRGAVERTVDALAALVACARWRRSRWPTAGPPPCASSCTGAAGFRACAWPARSSASETSAWADRARRRSSRAWPSCCAITACRWRC
jgi:3-deoxy-D-manno-octulosonic-acid transferase